MKPQRYRLPEKSSTTYPDQQYPKPVLATIRGTVPVKASNIATWALNQVSCFMSMVGSTNAYRLNGRQVRRHVLPAIGKETVEVFGGEGIDLRARA